MSSSKVLIIVGDATETLDTMYPYYRLIESGFQPVVAAPEKRRYQMVLHEVKPGWTITKEWEGYSIDADIAFSDVCEEEYAGIFFFRRTGSGIYSLRRKSCTHHALFLRSQQANRECLPRRGDSRFRRLR